MKDLLREWRDVTKGEYPEFVHLIPDPDKLALSKLNEDGVMTDTCAMAQKENRILAQSVNGHSVYCHHHTVCHCNLNHLKNGVSAVRVTGSKSAPFFTVFYRWRFCRFS